MARVVVERVGQHARPHDNTVLMSSYYLSKEWRIKREQRLQHDQYTCQGCGVTAKQLQELCWAPLQVHHKNAGPPEYGYPSFGNESLSDLLTLCPTCHDGITNSVRQQRFRLDPRKKVQPTLVAPSPLSNKSPQLNVRPTNAFISSLGPKPVAVPQRANRRSTELLRQSHEGDQRQKEED